MLLAGPPKPVRSRMREEAKKNDVESKWKNYHITTFLGQSLSKTLEEAMDLSEDRLILET
jgi:hypothetical protein